MNRRKFIKVSGGVTAAAMASAAVPFAAWAGTDRYGPNPRYGWRMFEVTTRVELPTAASDAVVWLPLPSIEDPAWIRLMGRTVLGNAETISTVQDTAYGASMLMARWTPGEATPVLEVTNRFATRDRATNFQHPASARKLDAESRALYTRATDLLPVDGIVAKTAHEIVGGKRDDLAKARAIYDWIVENTERNPATRGCGTGDIRGMLESGNLSGKCADLNALFVGLARAAGLPARDVYGIRVADSRFGYRSLGKSGDISKAQHCRAEVWLERFGWVPVDPADVRKVLLEEKPPLTLSDERALDVRRALFGAWEMNWLPYNVAHDVVLPGTTGPRIPFLMYPQGERAGVRFDSLDPATFVYRISSREVVA